MSGAAGGRAACAKRRESPSAGAASESWNVYIVRCADGSLYTGIAKNVPRRVGEHNSSSARAARYTRGRRPVTLAYRESAATRSMAGRREHQIKRMSRREKEALIAGFRA